MTGIESEHKKMTGKTIEANQIENQTTSAPASPPMASLPLSSSTKLDQEPNPFEQSFSGAAVGDDSTKENKKESDNSNNATNNNGNNSGRLTLPPVASITSPSPLPVIGGGVLPKEISNQFTWDTLRTGPLSPSMLQGPANSDKYYQQQQQQQQQQAQLQQQQKQKTQPVNNMNYSRSSFSGMGDQYNSPNMGPIIKSEPGTNTNYIQRKRSVSQQHGHDEDDDADSIESEPKRRNNRRRSSNIEDDNDDSNSNSSNGNGSNNNNSNKKQSRAGGAASGKNADDDEKRKNFLERNRIAALKCRQRKKQWLNNLQAKVEFLTSDNERLQLQSESLKEEIVNLKTLLLAHKECPVAQANGFQANAIQKSLSSMMPQQMMRPANAGMANLMSQPYGMPPAPASIVTQPGPAPNNTSRPLPPPPNALSQQPSLPPNPATSASASLPQFQRANMVPMPVQQVPPPNNQQGMVAGGSSSVLRF